MHLTRRGFFGAAVLPLALRPAAAAPLTPGKGAAATAQKAPAPVILEARPGKMDLGDDRILGFDGIAGHGLGPVLHGRVGQPMAVRLVNRLDHPTLLHWRGLRIANPMDGSILTQTPVPPGGSFDYLFTPPDAGTFAYEAAGPGAERGPVGVVVVAGQEPQPFDGDLVLALQDWTAPGAAEPIVTVNGRPVPDTIMAPAGARLRLRLVNLSRERMLWIGLEGASPHVIAIDGQPCEPFVPARDTMPIGPGARFDITCDLPAGETPVRLVLRNGRAAHPLVQIGRHGAAAPQKAPFGGLAANPLLPTMIALEKAARADLAIGEWQSGTDRRFAFDGTPGTLGMAPLLSVTRGRPISLGFINHTKVLQPIHVHGHAFRQLHLLDDGWDPFWRDNVAVPPGRTVRIAFVADNPGRWMIESALPARSAAGLWSWFEVR